MSSNPDYSKINPGSFRDPRGFIFQRGTGLYRQINLSAAIDYDYFISSGLYDELIAKKLLIPHHDENIKPEIPEISYKIIQPEFLPFISYPYEWCFSQLQDAALRTLQIQETALQYGMSLRDASAYNIQFTRKGPVFIDTLSFEIYQEGYPWIAYRQFCEHFLGPLLLMQYMDIRLGQLFLIFPCGIPLDFSSKMLPFRTWMKEGALIHIHLHAKSQKRYSNTQVPVQLRTVKKTGLIGLIKNLEHTTRSCRWIPDGMEWVDYYGNTNYTERGYRHKKKIVRNYIHEINPDSIWDLGANTGDFSRMGIDIGANVVSFDMDPGCIEILYRSGKETGKLYTIPLIQNLFNPSPGSGWNCKEHVSLFERGPVDLVMALALIHHLSISGNVPFFRIAEFFSRLGKFLIIEFVPKEDSQVKRLLCNRKDIFYRYSCEHFEKDFTHFFTIRRKEPVCDSLRILYLMEGKSCV